MDVVFDQFAVMMRRIPIRYGWRPRLRDRNDDLLLEAEDIFTQRASRASKARLLEVLERLGSEALSSDTRSCPPGRAEGRVCLVY